MTKEEQQEIQRLVTKAVDAVNELDAYCLDVNGNNAWYIRFNIIEINKSFRYIERNARNISLQPVSEVD
jgi:exosome complex RNA-binding protein Rrp42 (RNase PH superfamily)